MVLERAIREMLAVRPYDFGDGGLIGAQTMHLCTACTVLLVICHMLSLSYSDAFLES